MRDHRANGRATYRAALVGVLSDHSLVRATVLALKALLTFSLGQRPRFTRDHFSSAESAFHRRVMSRTQVESRFQRLDLSSIILPGALPQAKE